MRRFLFALLVLAALGAAAGWWLSRPVTAPQARLDAIAAHEPDLANGERVFHASGCASCHAAETDPAEEGAPPLLAGGHELATDYGTFVAPNITPHPERGIGRWSVEDFSNAMLRGVSPQGRHYYPAFPYPAYIKMTDGDIADLWAYLQTLPESDRETAGNALALPYSLRRGVGLWKRLHLDDDWVAAAPSEQLDRGRYLVEALAHCAECHTPRTATGGLDIARWMGGAPNPSGRGRIPNITPAALSWSAGDLAYYLETGFTPDYDSAGGSMASVVRNLARLPAEDRDAIAAYVKGLAPVAAPAE